MQKHIASLIIFLAGSIPYAAQAQAQDLLALPGETGLALWETQTPSFILNGVSGGTPGACYTYAVSENRLSLADDPIGCLDYLILPDPSLYSSDAAYAVTGTVAFMADPIGEFYQGFAITGVSGVDYCGERDGCDRIFIQGVTSPDLLAPLAAAARSNQPVDITGPVIWNLESRDIVIDSIR